MKNKIRAVANDIYLYFCFACRRLGIPGYQIHQIYLPDQELIYIPIPKNACTSIMHALYEIEFEEQYSHRDHRKEGYRDIHDYYQKRRHSFTGAEKLKGREDVTIFAVIRDPVKRLISCYRNRVVDLKDLESTKEELRQKGLPLEPDLNNFVLNLAEYRKANKIIEHHSRPQGKFLDGTLDYLERVYPIKKLDECMGWLKTFKPDLEIRRAKSGGSSFSLKDLSGEALEAAIAFYRQDYELLNEYFTPRKIRREYKELHRD